MEVSLRCASRGTGDRDGTEPPSRPSGQHSRHKKKGQGSPLRGGAPTPTPHRALFIQPPGRQRFGSEPSFALDDPAGTKTAWFVQQEGTWSHHNRMCLPAAESKEQRPPHSPLPKPQTGASKGKCLLSPLPGEGLDREIRMVSEKGACTVPRAEALSCRFPCRGS